MLKIHFFPSIFENIKSPIYAKSYIIVYLDEAKTKRMVHVYMIQLKN